MFFKRKELEDLIKENKREIDMLKGHLHIVQNNKVLDYKESDLTKIYEWFMKLLNVLDYEFTYQKEEWIITKKKG